MKIPAIRKAFIKQTVIVIGVLAVFAGLVWYIDSFNDEFDKDISQLNNETSTLARKVVDLNLQYSKVTSNMILYNDIRRKQENKMLMINKPALRDAIANSRNKYYFDGIDVKMGEIKPLAGDKYKTNTTFIEASNTSITIHALTDLDVLGLIEVLQNSFSGIKFTSLKITAEKSIDNAALIAVKDTGFSPIVNARMNFTLFGLRNVNASDNELLNDGSGAQTPATVPGGNMTRNKRIRLRTQ